MHLGKNASSCINWYLVSPAVKANSSLVWKIALLKMSQFKPQFCGLFAEGLEASYNTLCAQVSRSLK